MTKIQITRTIAATTIRTINEAKVNRALCKITGKPVPKLEGEGNNFI